MDENGWILRTTYLQDKVGNIYEATLNIADGRDRKILYDINNIRLIDKKRTADGDVPSTANGRGSHINSSSSETGAAKSTNPSPGAARSTAQVSTDSIRGESENVNGLPVKQQFSLSEPVEQTETLLALHNMDEEKLRRTLNLGSWPSPSIAIVEAEQGHANYGEYSAVFPRSVIDPEADSRNKVYGSDAWTPTWRNAQVEYEVDYETKKAIENKVRDLSRQVAGGIFSKSSIISSRVNDTSDMDADKLAERLAGDDTVRAAYLADTGGTLEPVMKSKEWDNFGNGVLQQFIDEVGVQELARAEAEIEADNGSETVEQYKPLIQSIVREDYRKSSQSFLNRKPELIEKRLDSYIENRASSYFRIEDFIKHAWQMYEDGGATNGDIDRYATEDALRAAVNDEDVAEWIRGQMDDLVGEPGIYNGKERYTSSGNSRSFASLHWEYNAENIVRAMNLAEDRGEGYWGASAEGMMAMATPQYGSVDEMHADEARLRTENEEDRKSRFESIDNQIRDIISAVRAETKAHASSSYEENDIIGSVLMQAATGDKSFDVCVCEKTIYNYVNNGVFLTVTNKDLPERGERKREYKEVRAARSPKGESIEHRPENINERVEPGHWEMDTVKGKQTSKKCVLVLTERVSRNEITLPMYGCTMENVVAALNTLQHRYGDLFGHVFRSITVDNGSEFQDYDGMRMSPDGSVRTRIFYCHPYSSYERGSNENLNKMFRRLFPKGTNFDYVDDEEIIKAADWMNNYPRKVLGRTTAARRFNELLSA